MIFELSAYEMRMLYANAIVALIGFFYLSHLLRGERWVEKLFSPTRITYPAAISAGPEAEPCDLH